MASRVVFDVIFLLVLGMHQAFGQDVVEACATSGCVEPNSLQDETSLLQKAPAVVTKRGATAGEATPPASVVSIPLQKQYVPVSKEGKVIAYKTAYFGELSAGTPKQPFTVVFDTGSGHVVLPKSSCRSEACSKHRNYHRQDSSNAMDIDYNGKPLNPDATERDSVVVSYGTGKVTGEFVQDVVCLGPLDSGCVNLRVVLATEMSDDPFNSFAFDGIMGLGLDSLRLDPKFSMFGEMIAQNPGMLPQFSFFLSRHEDGESRISFGGVDKERATTDVAWTPVAMAELGYWQVQIKQVRIGNTILDDCAQGDCRAILDTGTSLLGVPKQSTREMHRLLARPVPSQVSDPNDIDCRQVPGLTIDFDLGDTVISIPVEDYSRPAPINMTTADGGSSLICRSLLLPIDMKAPVGPKIFIWGEPVLRRYMTVYDLDKKQIGFSLARQTLLPSGKASSSIGAPPEGSLLAGAPLAGASTSRTPPSSPQVTTV